MNIRPEVKSHKPNAISSADRLFSALLGVALLGYGIAGLMTAHMDLNGRRIRIAVLEGGPAWLMAAAFIVGALILFSLIVDHYDTRDNERYYRAFRRGAKFLGSCLAISALLAHIYLGFTR